MKSKLIISLEIETEEDAAKIYSLFNHAIINESLNIGSLAADIRKKLSAVYNGLSTLRFKEFSKLDRALAENYSNKNYMDDSANKD